MGEPLVETALCLEANDGGRAHVRLCSWRSLYRHRGAFPTIAIDRTEEIVLEQERALAERHLQSAEQERQAAQADDQAKDRLLALVSHELRNPLNPALMAAQALAGRPDLPRAARDLADVITRNLHFEARLIDDLLDGVRVARGRLDVERQPIDLHAVIHDALSAAQPLAEARGVRLSAGLHAHDHWVHGDAPRLRQLFWNLLVNAVKFSSERGDVLIRTTNKNGRIEVAVRDYGAGMSTEVKQRLFLPFGRRDAPAGERGGLGLGLTICKGIVDAHEGELRARSDGPGTGSTFEVALASIPRPHAATSPHAFDARELAAPAAVPTAGRRRALIVEDYGDSADMLAIFLETMAFGVTVGRSLAEGLGHLAHGPWDVVISDIGLGDGSGLEMARHARNTLAAHVLIAMSGFAGSDQVKASLEAGFDYHLVKPVDLPELQRLLATEVSADS